MPRHSKGRGAELVSPPFLWVLYYAMMLLSSTQSHCLTASKANQRNVVAKPGIIARGRGLVQHRAYRVAALNVGPGGGSPVSTVEDTGRVELTPQEAAKVATTRCICYSTTQYVKVRANRRERAEPYQNTLAHGCGCGTGGRAERNVRGQLPLS